MQEQGCETDYSSSEDDILADSEDDILEDLWIPARQSLTGTKMFIPAMGNGNGRGLINENWTTGTLLDRDNKWAKLIEEAESEKEMKEGTHYVFTEWKPTSILFARGKRPPIVGMRVDNAMSLRATKVFLHVGKVDAIINMPKKQNKPTRTQTTACVWGSDGKDDNDSNKFSPDRARYRSTISHERAIAWHFRIDAGSALP